MGKIKELKSEQDTAMLVVRTLREKYFKGDALEEVLEGHHWDNLEDSIESKYNMKEINEAIEEHAKKLGIVRDLRIIQYKMGLRDIRTTLIGLCSGCQHIKRILQHDGDNWCAKCFVNERKYI